MGGIQFGIYSLPDTIAEINNLVTQISTGLTDLEGNLGAEITAIGSKLDLIKPAGEVLYTSPEITNTGSETSTCYGGRYYVQKTGFYNIKIVATYQSLAVWKIKRDADNILNLPVNTVLTKLVSGTNYENIGNAVTTSGGGIATINCFLQAGEVVIITGASATGYFEISGQEG